MASQTHSHDGDADHDGKVGKLVGLSAYLPIGTEMPAFFGLVQRVYVLAFPPANADNHGQRTTSLSCNLSALQAAPREPYSATLLLQDAHQVRAHPHTLHAAALTVQLLPPYTLSRTCACCEYRRPASFSGTCNAVSLPTHIAHMLITQPKREQIRQAVLLQGEGKVYRFSKLAVVSSCMSSQAIKCVI